MPRFVAKSRGFDPCFFFLALSFYSCDFETSEEFVYAGGSGGAEEQSRNAEICRSQPLVVLLLAAHNSRAPRPTLVPCDGHFGEATRCCVFFANISCVGKGRRRRRTER
uniref:Uncharacterized protein n=1 Tax=Zea mays TaxID=4577 RepID=A0A804RNS2_MAIZE